VIPLDPPETHDFLLRLIHWLREQEHEAEYSLEATLAFGGLGVGERMFGFEDEFTGYSPLDEKEAVSAPTAPDKKIIVGFHLNIAGSPGVVTINKTKAGVDFPIATLDVSSSGNNIELTETGGGFVTLDAADESIRILAVSGATDITWSGSFVLVD